MKDYCVSYYLSDFYHTYTIEAENEFQAMQEALNRIPEGSQKLFHDFKIKRTETIWN